MPVREVQVDQGAEVAAHSDVLKLLFREPHGHGFCTVMLYCREICSVWLSGTRKRQVRVKRSLGWLHVYYIYFTYASGIVTHLLREARLRGHRTPLDFRPSRTERVNEWR